MKVTAVIVTRGNVSMEPVIDSLPRDWEVVIWENGDRVTRSDGFAEVALDLAVYGRYAAIEYATHDLVYCQDDDVIVSDPQAIVDAWRDVIAYDGVEGRVADPRGFLVANQPQEFRHDGYTDSCLVGFGACFHRSLPGRAFGRFFTGNPATDFMAFNRCCDVIFTTLTPRVLVDVPKTDREFASDPDRMWKQPDHYGERTRMLDLARKVRDG